MIRRENEPGSLGKTKRRQWLREWLAPAGIILAGIPAFFSTRKILERAEQKEEGERLGKADAYLRKLARKLDPAEVKSDIISLGIGEETAGLLARVNHEVYGDKMSSHQLAAIARHGNLYGINPLRVINTFSHNSPLDKNKHAANKTVGKLLGFPGNLDLQEKFESFDQPTRTNLVMAEAYHRLNPDRFLLMEAHEAIYGFPEAQEKLKRKFGELLKPGSAYPK